MIVEFHKVIETTRSRVKILNDKLSFIDFIMFSRDTLAISFKRQFPYKKRQSIFLYRNFQVLRLFLS